MISLRWVPAVVAAAFGLLSFVTPARAQLELCNRTSYILYTATAVQDKKGETTQGWTRVVPGDCKTAIPDELGKSTYYVYARTSPAHGGPLRAWGGNVKLCTAESNFRVMYKIGTVKCDAEATALPFAKIDTKGKDVWTTTFTESAALDTAEAARTAGLKRLLRDNGAKIASIDGKPDAATGNAMSGFRKHMRIAKTAGTPAMFDALETEALKTAAPAGYSICNDTEDVVWAVIALKGQKDWLSRGWWKVPAGSCARALTAALTFDKVYLHVEKHGNAKLVGGPEKFCMTNTAFEIQGRGNCAKKNFIEAGFAVTTTNGLGGYAAHVGNQGLVPPLKAANAKPR